LTKDWNFKLHEEYRNKDVWMLFAGSEMPERNWRVERELLQLDCLMPARTELVFDRLYIRQDNDEYASATFMIKEHQDDRYIGERFWVKLVDANTIECETTSTGNPVGGFAKNVYKGAVLNKKDPSRVVKAVERKRAKEEIEAARDAVYAYCSTKFSDRTLFGFGYGKNLHFEDTHLNSIAKEYIKLGGSDYVYQKMSSKPYTSQQAMGWICDKTRRLDGGTVERDFRVPPPVWPGHDNSKIKLSGLTVVSRGTNIIEIRNLI